MELGPDLGTHLARSVIAPAMSIETAIIQWHFSQCKEWSPSTELVGEAGDGALVGHTLGSSPLSSHWEHGAGVALSTSFRASQPFLNDNLFTQARRNSFLATVYTPNADFSILTSSSWPSHNGNWLVWRMTDYLLKGEQMRGEQTQARTCTLPVRCLTLRLAEILEIGLGPKELLK